MEQVLASGGGEDVSARVAALLAGSNLTTSKGVAKGEGREVDGVEYEGGEKITFSIGKSGQANYKIVLIQQPQQPTELVGLTPRLSGELTICPKL